jgi:hypothetical protein
MNERVRISTLYRKSAAAVIPHKLCAAGRIAGPTLASLPVDAPYKLVVAFAGLSSGQVFWASVYVGAAECSARIQGPKCPSTHIGVIQRNVTLFTGTSDDVWSLDRDSPRPL